MLIGFVQGYEELKWGISKLNPLCNGPLETFMGVEQRTVLRTNPRISPVVSKSDSDQGTATSAHRTLGLTPAGTICRSNLSLGHHPLLSLAYHNFPTERIKVGLSLPFKFQKASNN